MPSFFSLFSPESFADARFSPKLFNFFSVSVLRDKVSPLSFYLHLLSSFLSCFFLIFEVTIHMLFWLCANICVFWLIEGCGFVFISCISAFLFANGRNLDCFFCCFWFLDLYVVLDFGFGIHVFWVYVLAYEYRFLIMFCCQILFGIVFSFWYI